MLIELNVKDIALIRQASVELGEGLNILTGETGTGKSVIIDSVMLALGGKVRGDMIRKGAEYAYIELIFQISDKKKAERLKALDVDTDENGQLIISRKIMPGRSISRINDESVTLSRLSEVTGELIDIYGQNEFHTLMDKRQHLKILDGYIADDAGGLMESVKKAYHAFKAAEEALSGFDMDEKERLRETDLLSYEINEIDSADIKDGEEEELSQRFKKLNNAKRILDHVAEAHRIIEDIELGRAAAGIEQAMHYDESLSEIFNEIVDAQSIVDAALGDINAYVKELEIDDAALAQTESRLDLIRGLEAKYGRSEEEIFKYRENAKNRLTELESYEENRLKAQKALEEALKILSDSCKKLSQARKKGAEKLCGAISAELKELGFEKAVISMEFKDKAPSVNGSDEICFLAALNPGEDLKPLNEVVSGGELSRVMLAIKTIMARTDDMPTLIFDEIDTGISGRTAQMIAEKLNVISGSHQVICVSHLPQIAAMADSHFVIQKNEVEGRNITEIKKLSGDGSVAELARLLGGASITKAVMENAAELKKLAAETKLKSNGV